MTDRDAADENGVGCTGQQLTYELEPDEPPSEAVVRAVADATGTGVLDLDPLYDVVDPDHLDGVVTGGGDRAVDTEMTFRFNGCRVTLTPGTVVVRPPDPDDG